jgi:hypothetical protein
MRLVAATTQLRVGRSWTYVDQIGRPHRYEVTAVLGDLVVIRKTTLQEEIIVARTSARRKDFLELLSVRLTGVPASANSTPPAPTGFTVDLSVPSQFTVSIDHHVNLVTGSASASFERHAAAWRLGPAQPGWAVPRIVNARVSFAYPAGLSIVNTIGGP